jgi:hypothetical protein
VWPFSKKNQHPYDSHCELPPGVVLATEEEGELSGPPVTQHFQAEHTLNAQPDANPETVIAPQPPHEATLDLSSPAAFTQANGQLLDLFTPPASPEVHWPPMQDLAFHPGADSTSFEEEGSENASAHALEASPGQAASFESAFAMDESAHAPAFEHWETPQPQPESASMEYASSETPDLSASFSDAIPADTTPESNATICMPDSTVLNNVVPFPIRHTQASKESALDFLEAASADDALGLAPGGLIFEEEPVSPSNSPSMWESGSLSPQDSAEEVSFWSSGIDTEGVYTLGDEATGLEVQPETFCMEQQVEEAALWQENDAVGDDFALQDTAEGMFEILPAQGEEEAYATQPDALPDELSGASFDEEAGPDLGDSWDFEEPTEGSSVKEWATYDLGHYDDPDSPAEPLVLGEEPESLETIAGELQASLEALADPAVACNTQASELPAPMADGVYAAEPTEAIMPKACTFEVWPESPSVCEVSEAYQPFIETPQASEPLQGELVAPDWKKASAPVSVAKAMNSFSQQIILEESRAIKRSIDELVDRYFSQQTEHSTG